MKYLKTFEKLTSLEDFNKAVYLPEDRAIIAPYMITKDDGKSINVLNIKEITNREGVFMDNRIPYDITIHNTLLDKSKVQVLGEVPDVPGFYYIKIPYWIYKSNKDGLDIQRCKAPQKRLSIPAVKTQDDKEFMSNFKDENVIKYIKTVNSDERTHFLLGLYKDK